MKLFIYIKQISKHMSSLGMTKYYEATMKKISIGKYLENMVGKSPANMKDPHAHHILFKKGRGAAQQQLVKEGQDILRKYGIDPILGLENLVWAPNRVAGQHDFNAIKHVVDELKIIDGAGLGYKKIVEQLEDLGRLASER